MKTRRKEITLENCAKTRGPGWVGEEAVDWFHLLQDRISCGPLRTEQ